MKNLLYIIYFACLLCSSCRQTDLKGQFVLITPMILSESSINCEIQASYAYGDIIAYHIPGYDTIFPIRSLSRDKSAGFVVLRIVGLPGDSISITNDYLSINGRNCFSEFRREFSYPVFYPEDEWDLQEYIEVLPNGVEVMAWRNVELSEMNMQDMEMLEVPEGYYFVLGDFRSGSIDSRHFGCVKGEEILGKVNL